MTSKVRIFDARSAAFDTYRSAGEGEQRVCNWIGAEDGHPCTIGVGELKHIRIADYRFGFSDFLHVIEGEARITQDGVVHDLGPGQSIYIPKGAVVTLEIADRLLWLYVTNPSNWDGLATDPASVSEYHG
ncbi:MAG: cupin domain-containing protein [Alphaproteobacteria bacterium]|nr:cupin domain-containing protein [Alphaproteobacteria bacterium]